MLFGVLAGVLAHSGDLGSAIAIGGQAFAVDNQLRFSRSAEHEADRVGFLLLAGAGYDPYAMTAFFARLDRATMSDTGIPAYARTHPLTGERIADMEDRARRAAIPAAASGGRVRFRARAGALAAGPLAQRIRRRDFAHALRNRRPHGAERRGELVWHRVWPDAARALRRRGFVAGVVACGVFGWGTGGRRRNARTSRSLDVLAADIARRAGHDEDAVRLADLAQKRWPQSNAAIDMHIRTLLSLRRFAEAQALSAEGNARASRISRRGGCIWRRRARGRGRCAHASSRACREIRAGRRVAVRDPPIKGRARYERRSAITIWLPSTRGCTRWRTATRKSGWMRRVRREVHEPAPAEACKLPDEMPNLKPSPPDSPGPKARRNFFAPRIG